MEFLTHERLPHRQWDKADAYLWQGYDFFQAASNPRVGSRPLLYYYAFLNASKAFLLASGVSLPPRMEHGIVDPRANARQRLTLESQAVRLEGRTAQNDQLFPELITSLGPAQPSRKVYRVLDLMAQVVPIHATYMAIGRGRRTRIAARSSPQTSGADRRSAWRRGPCFVRVADLSLMQNGHEYWVALTVDGDLPESRTVVQTWDQTLSKTPGLTRVRTALTNAFSFETPAISATRGRDQTIARLAEVLRSHVWAALEPNGYAYYLGSVPQRDRLPQLASIYAIMFFLGSVTRYRPYDYDTIVGGRYAWLVEEFVATQPYQFLYLLASTLAGSEVSNPWLEARP